MTTVIVGGTRGLGLEIARHRHKQGEDVVLTGRDPARAAEVAAAIGPRTVLVACSAPSYAHGVVDPVTEIAGVAERAGRGKSA